MTGNQGESESEHSETIVESATAELPTDPARVRGFALFFKRYMNVSTIVVAALPIPAGYVVPSFTAQSSTLSIYTSMFCFLALGFIFFLRHRLARFMFSHEIIFSDDSSDRSVGFWTRLPAFAVAVTPLLLICLSLYSAYEYHDTLIANVQYIQEGRTGAADDTAPEETRLESEWMRLANEYARETNINLGEGEDLVGSLPSSFVLEHAGSDAILDYSWLLLWYLLTFLSAEAAFILMALKEYLQDLLHVSELEMIRCSRHLA